MLLGIALLVLAGPRLSAEVALLLAERPLREAEAGRPVAPPDLRHTAEVMEFAATHGTAARTYDSAGRAWLALAGTLDRGVFDRAARSLMAGLALAPGDSRSWLLLAHVEHRRNRLLEAARAWRLSVVTGLFDPELMFQREQSGLALWPYMDLDARDAFGRQLAVHWAWGPSGLSELIHRFNAIAIAQHALAGHPEAAADLTMRVNRRAENDKARP
ncbi:hypothetical protein [Azospirillum sp. sgz301742]